MNIDIPERHISLKFKTHHDHPCYPEKDDVETRHKDTRRIEGLKIDLYYQASRESKMARGQTKTMYLEHPHPERIFVNHSTDILTGSSRDTIRPFFTLHCSLFFSWQYHAGILCPHHIWRDIHQSLIFSIQAK